MKLKYTLLGFISWFVVDWGTAGAFKFSYYENILSDAVGVYILYSVVFAYLIFKFNLKGKGLFVTTSFVAIASEIILFKNSLLLTFPKLLFFIPAAICIYSFLVYMPLWIVKKEVKKNKNKVLFLLVVTVLMILLSVISQNKI